MLAIARRTLTAAAVLAGSLLPVAAADARPGDQTWRIVSATHTSSSAKQTGPEYVGSSSARWKVAKPITFSSTYLTAVLELPLTGTFRGGAVTNRPGNCALETTTANPETWGVAGRSAQLSIGPDPAAPKRIMVALLAYRATLGNPYFGSECSTDVSGEPDAVEVGKLSLAKTAFRPKRVKLRFAGQTNREGIAYEWKTTLVLKRTAGKSL